MKDIIVKKKSDIPSATATRQAAQNVKDKETIEELDIITKAIIDASVKGEMWVRVKTMSMELQSLLKKKGYDVYGTDSGPMDREVVIDWSNDKIDN